MNDKDEDKTIKIAKEIQGASIYFKEMANTLKNIEKALIDIKVSLVNKK